MTKENLKEEIWKRYGSFELSHDKNEAIVNNIFEFILKERREYAKSHVSKALEAAEKSDFIDAKGISISPKSNELHWTAYGNIGKIIYKPEVILKSYSLDLIK